MSQRFVFDSCDKRTLYRSRRKTWWRHSRWINTILQIWVLMSISNTEWSKFWVIAMMICVDHIKLWWFCSICHQDDNHQTFNSIRIRHCEHSETHWSHLVDVSSDEMLSLKSSTFWKLLTSAMLRIRLANQHFVDHFWSLFVFCIYKIIIRIVLIDKHSFQRNDFLIDDWFVHYFSRVTILNCRKFELCDFSEFILMRMFQHCSSMSVWWWQRANMNTIRNVSINMKISDRALFFQINLKIDLIFI
jgi:hypothetical protein